MCKCWDSALHLAAGNIEILQTPQKYRTLYNVDTGSLNFKRSQNYKLVNNSTINGLCHVSGMYYGHNKLQTEDTAPFTKINYSLYIFNLKKFSIDF